MSDDDRKCLPINLDTVHCPRCGRTMPIVRIPADVRELMWGGWTCPECGCRMDKWGNAVPQHS